ncbi:hypothetical protein PILCRDRAFT_826026 [Piloderma croceum F 1598]|uniref:mRNA export factor GLE1 n=1 Tax=Piloderma croceum (strain F 1598) TaxID=765440 RepID=A0A0C3ASB3_PILCF|nr:hypothetical protein PILCRDRAFT_826026 [Piloderma croceum F 1598]
MRFSVPRSTSPSPERIQFDGPSTSRRKSPNISSSLGLGRPRSQRRSQPRRTSTYGIHSDSESESDGSEKEPTITPVDLGDAAESQSEVDLTDAFKYVSISPTRNPLRPRPNPLEARQVEETVAAIRLHAKHHDPYEDWEKQTRRDAFRTARKIQSSTLHSLHTHQSTSQSRALTHQSTIFAAQHARISQALTIHKARLQREEAEMRRVWGARDQELWARVEGGIKWEEERVGNEMEVERRRVEEEEKKAREAEMKRRLEEERKRAEEEKARLEEERVAMEKGRLEEERRKEEELANARKEAERAEEQERKALGMSTADEDWRNARVTLKRLKSGPMRTVKSTKQFKSTWSSIRRQITPKIGQLTNDSSSINLISTQLYNLLMPSAASASSFNAPSQPHPDEIYISLLSSLAKAILLQAETEVTASKTAAVPLAMVAKNLLGTLPHFEDVLLAKMVQRVGGWGVPTSLPARDVDVDGSDSNQPFDEVSLRKAMGYRDVPAHVDEDNGKQIPGQRESQAEYITRVSGIMRVYFFILIGEGGVDRPMNAKVWQTGRYWGYFARMLGGCVGGGLESAVAAEILYVALDVGGHLPAQIWGRQWIKLLALLYDGVMSGKVGGDTTAEGKAARVRVQLDIERIMSVNLGTGTGTSTGMGMN